jgi:hypothetical protein
MLVSEGLEFVIEPEASPLEELTEFLSLLDGKRSLNELEAGLSPEQRERMMSLVQDLDANNLLDDAEQVFVRTGTQALVELEVWSKSLSEQLLSRNTFWTRLQHAPGGFSSNVLKGFFLERYHLLSREASFISPLLSFAGNRKIRELLNDLYHARHGREVSVRQSLEVLGTTQEELDDTMPLPMTLGICNALVYWASSDPLFVISLLDYLVGNADQVRCIMHACKESGLEPRFVSCLSQHVSEQDRLDAAAYAHRIFTELEYVDDASFQRMKRQARLFFDMYDSYYAALWDYYSNPSSSARRLSKI